MSVVFTFLFVSFSSANQVVAAAKARGVEITTLLCTHKHWDHSGGNEAMKKMVRMFYPPCEQL